MLTLFSMALENGEVIVGRIKEDQKNDDDIFAKRVQKYQTSSLGFTFSRLNAIQSHFIAQVACGTSHAILLTQSGFVYSFGKNLYGQLGHSSQ